MTSYTVQKGDTLFKIAKKFSITLINLIAANSQIENPDLIMPGQIINIPNQGQTQAPGNGGGRQNEPGIPGQKPLRVVDVTWEGKPSQDATVIPKKDTLTVIFDKNVVNDAVWENNRQSLSLTSGQNNIPIHVTRIRDAVDFAMRENIFIQPVKPLTSGQVYTLRIAPELKSLAGVTLASSTGGKGYTIELKTES